MAITYYSSRGYSNKNQSNSVLSNPTGITYLSSRGYSDTEDKNRGGFLGGLGYLGEKLAVGFVSSIEGITDYAFSGLAKLFGNDAWAEELIRDDWFGDWYSHPEEWFNPSEGWKVAGDVAGGIGTSLPGMAAAVGVGVATGGLGAGAAASFITSGLGAAGRATKEAYQQTGQLTGKEYGYGALVGATEGGIEALGNLLSLGGGAVVKSVSKAIGKETAEAFAKQGILKTLGASFAGEAFEEGFSEWITPYWQKATYDPKAKNATADEILYASLVGGLSGVVMGGGGYVIDSANSFSKGNKLAISGGDAQVLETSGYFSAFEDANQSGDELFSEISSRRKSLLESLQKTGGKAVTLRQKRDLGALERANIAGSMKLFVATRAQNIVNNAPLIAERLTAFGYKTADGKPIRFTAEEITAGYDPKKPSSIYKALQTNSKLRELAVSDATGQLMMDTNEFAKATMMGKKLASQVDINRFYENATREELQAVTDALKIDSWEGLTADSFAQKISDFLVDGGAERAIDANERRAAFEALTQDTVQSVPKYIGMGQDGMARYSDGQLDIGVERRGDSYRTYNYATKHMSKDLTVGEINSFFRDYGARRDEYAAAERERIESEQRRKNEIAEVDSFARENVKEYKSLNAPNQSMIRRLIREGRAKGLSDSDVAMFAKVSAHSGIDIQFDKEANYRGTKEDGTADYADGFYEAAKNRIVVNPEGKRTAERLLIHELDHAIRKYFDSEGKPATRIYLEAIEGVDQATRDRITEAYKKTAKPGESVAAIMDETNAYYAEQVLGNKYTLEKLIEAEPTLKDKILSFFKGAEADYADTPKLSGAAKKYYRTYKKLFDDFSARNAQSNANEKTLTNMNQEDMSVSGRQYAIFYPSYSDNDISLENSSGKDFALDIDSEGENISGAEVMSWLNKKSDEENISGAEVMSWLNKKPEGDEFNSPTISTVGKERVTYQEKFGSKEWRKTKSESAYIHAVDEMYGIQSYLEKVGKVKNAKAIIQNVRSTPHQAQSMIGSVQYNIFESDSKSAKKMGEGLNEIFRPIEKMGDKAAIDFDDYLLNSLNVDKYQVIEKTQRHDKDAAESLGKIREEISNLEDQRSELENRIFNLGNSPAEVRIKEGLKKSIEKIDNKINKSRSDEIALLSEAPGYAEAELKKLINETADLLGEKERAKAEIYTLGNDESQMKRKVELKERISNIEGKLKRLEESAAAMEEIAKAYKIAIKPVFNLDGATISKEESQRLIREYEKKYPEFKKIAQKVWNFNKNLNTMRVSAGLISKRIADRLAIMYPHYVPSFKAKINNNAQVEGGVSVASTVKKAKGYNSNIMSVKESMASQVSQVIRNGNINMLANKVYDNAVKTGDSKYVDIKLPDVEGKDISTEGIERPKPHTLTFFKEGKEYKIDISEEIYQGFKGIGDQSAPDSNVFAKVTNRISDKYKKLVTSYSPAFMIRNAIRDMQDAGLNSKHPLLFARNISRAWVELVNNSENWQTYRAYGGFSSTVFDSKGVSGDVGARGFEILGIKDRIESGDKLSVKDAKYLKSIFTGVENLNAVVEQIPRFAEYLASIEAGETIEQAIYNSAEVTTNFGRRGATTKQLNATIIPFLNPAVQGFDKIFRNVTDAAKAGDAKAVTKAFGTLLGKAIAIGILPMLFNSLMYDDDEDYKDLREEDKENNYLIKLPNGTFLKLPRGRVASVIGGLYNRTAKMAKGEDADWLGYLDNVKSQVTPVENLTRTVFSPFMDVAMNRTWYGTEIEGMQFENVRPKDRYDESTSSIAIAIGQVFNYSPKKIHYLIDQYSGVIGDFLLPATSKKAEKDFFSGNFTIDAATSNKLSTNFYKLYDEAQYSKTDGSVKSQYQVKYLNKVKSAVSEMYKEINAIQNSDLTTYEKLQQVRVLRVMINEAYKNAIADYDQINAAIDATANMGFDDSDSGQANIRYAEIIRQVYGAERALSEYNGTVYSNMTVLNTAGISYETLYDYYFGTRNIESDVDSNGDTISGSKRKKVVSAISSLGVSVEERLLLIAASGYALKDGDVRGLSAEGAKTRLLKYILKYNGLSGDERLALAEMCGFEVKNGRIVNNFSKKLKKLSKK